MPDLDPNVATEIVYDKNTQHVNIYNKFTIRVIIIKKSIIETEEVLAASPGRNWKCVIYLQMILNLCLSLCNIIMHGFYDIAVGKHTLIVCFKKVL